MRFTAHCHAAVRSQPTDMTDFVNYQLILVQVPAQRGTLSHQSVRFTLVLLNETTVIP